MFAGICFESGYVQGSLGKHGLLKGGSLSSKCVYVKCIHMSSFFRFKQDQTKPATNSTRCLRLMNINV